MTYPLYSAKAGTTVIDEATFNGLLALHDFELVYTGSDTDAKVGSGVAEFDCASYHHCIRFKAWSTTTMCRVEFGLAQDGAGADLTLELRSGMTPASGVDGTLLASVKIPGEWIPATAGTVSIPLVMTGLTSDGTYWLVVKKAGDGTDHFHLIGETSQDANYPCYYRAADSGNWTLEDSIHFTVYSGTTGDIVATIRGGNAICLLEYDGDEITTVKRFIPSVDETDDGIRDTMTLTWTSGVLERGVVT